jgi:NAD+ kinase
MFKKIAVISALNNSNALIIKQDLIKKFNFFDLEIDNQDAIKKSCEYGIDLIIAIGGDGLMLRVLHAFEHCPITIYGINCGTIGFLMNSFDKESILENIAKAQIANIHPLRMIAIDCNEKKYSFIAINEVALLRQSNQACKIGIEINGQERLACLSADGVMVATPAGSTAYNLSAGGPIIPFGAELMALTAISPFRPRKWSGALLPSNSKIKFKILDHQQRPISATADSREVRDVVDVEVYQEKNILFKILFDSNHSLEERIIREQFFNNSNYGN